MIKSARKLVVEPQMTVGLRFRFAAFMTSLGLRFFFLSFRCALHPLILLKKKKRRSASLNLPQASCWIPQTSARQFSVLCWRRRPFLLRLLKHLTDTLNNSDSENKRPTRLGLAATMTLGQLFTVSDS